MPAGKFSLYLYHDDARDMQARATIERVSQPLRGEFLRAAAISGAILAHIDVRLPAMLTSLFVGQLQANQFSELLILLAGKGGISGAGENGVYPWEAGKFTGSSERRRFTLVLNDDVNTSRLMQLLEDASSRQRGTLLRELVIAGCALHELDRRFPRLLSSMPQPPATLYDLQVLTGQLLEQNFVTGNPEFAPVITTPPVIPETNQDVVRQNMKKLL